MGKLPVVSGWEALEAFRRLGWIYKRRESSHLILTKPGVFAALCVPDDAEIKPGTLRALIGNAGISVDDFLAALAKR
jgi:predicted RNA binding protein YcfA (HicA-like mRNA interferase family)